MSFMRFNIPTIDLTVYYVASVDMSRFDTVKVVAGLPEGILVPNLQQMFRFSSSLDFSRFFIFSLLRHVARALSSDPIW